MKVCGQKNVLEKNLTTGDAAIETESGETATAEETGIVGTAVETAIARTDEMIGIEARIQNLNTFNYELLINCHY